MDDWIMLQNGLRVYKIFDGLYAATWKGNASIICGKVKMNLREIDPAARRFSIDLTQR
ncbi:MAG: hypothetical protein NZ992_02210 [Candidatus Korarchaeum sp.]|nr:hypothetical protein [Candidatus Korarchaeum sp.]MDW8036182.1 hypothetical protein [Candidatus Korarchaeum sp.]